MQLTPFPILIDPSDRPCVEIHRLIDNKTLIDRLVKNDRCFLSYKNERLNINLSANNECLSAAIDFIDGKSKHRRQYGGGKKQPLAKACGLDKHPKWRIFDATAGLGKDAFVLASLGGHVTLCEQHPALYSLLVDALSRAAKDDEVGAIVTHMSCVHYDAVEYLDMVEKTPESRPDVVYLDPMYPDRKKSAKIKKEMQILQALVGHTGDAENLLDQAIQTALHRVVVKRPKSADPLGHHAVSYTVSSVNTRYDVYVI